MRRARARIGARLGALLALALAGCAENAILELELQLPLDSEVAASFVSLEFDSREPPPIYTSPPETLPLSEERTRRVSVIASGEQIERPLFVRARFCRSQDCSAIEDNPVDPVTMEPTMPGHEVRYERAFYLGQRTRHSLDLRAAPRDGRSDVDVCEVEGCFEGNLLTWCEDGHHLCER